MKIFNQMVHVWSVAQLCPTLCDPRDCSSPGYSVHGVSQQEYLSSLPFPTPGNNHHGVITHLEPDILEFEVKWVLKGVFIPIPKKGNAKECSNYHTIALISHISNVMLKMLQSRS